MLKNPKVGDLIANEKLELIGKIIEVNDYWGWFKVQYPDKVKEYRIVGDGNIHLRRLLDIECSDYYLIRESLGITDSWRE